MPDAGADAHGERVLQVFGDGGQGVSAPIEHGTSGTIYAVGM